ncbi:uroporphyrinogen-III synthase [Roseivivax sp. THAF40]|uniref:uroporphyrinogen-III synthase n=1 Tax=unclassified Roseivivax TaxID=2639302 RepID=UPI0012695783|nr:MULTISPECIES: uroporphyrinogen-III synthase [unclassified Roseivivax]QFS84710.1 uroporphyrinogen-III synthase [Roseivivax sp. THAF197b]QFT48537.1 uroporphyrinogen-III synthase [Roseivivax sp. THAF40]
MPSPILLLTRPDAAANAFAGELEVEGIRPESILISPLIEISFTRQLPDMAPYLGLIFTSANGVHAYRDAGGPYRDICFTVGDATARAAREAGLHPVSAQGSASDLTALILREAPAGPLLHLRGEHSRGAVAETLNSAGIETNSAVLYAQELVPLSKAARDALNGKLPVVAPFFSPRTARAFADHGPFTAPLYLAAMSEAVAAPLQPLGAMALETAAQPNGTSLRRTVKGLWQKAQSLEGGDAGQ